MHRHIDPWPAHRKKGPNTPSRLHEATRGALGRFCTQSPSFLDSQRPLPHTQGHHTGHTLLGVAPIPCAHQIRPRRDPLAPSRREPVFLDGVARLAQPRMVAPCRALDTPRLVALEGPHYVSSHAMPCPHGLPRHLTKGPTLSAPAALTPVRGGPGPSQGIALPPEDILPQDGHAKQACERAAGTRWRATHAARVAPPGGPFLGAALSRTPPFGAWGLHHRGHCLVTCKPDAPPTCAERVACWQATGGLAERAGRRWHGRFTAVPLGRYRNDVLLRGGDDAGSVPGFAITVVHAPTGAPRSHHRGISHPRLTADNVVHVAPARRGRWKIAHAKNHVLKTKGSHLDHNLGPGQQSRAAVMRSLTLLALLCHTVVAWSDAKDAVLRPVLARRQTFFHALQAFMRSRVFDSGDPLINFMRRGLALASQFDTS